jgi:single-strand DNA-binding protein
MAEGLNRVLLIGNLGADPELRYGQGSGNPFLTMRIATSESYFDKRSNERREKTEWHDVTLFGNAAEPLSKFLRKGRQVFVEGRLETSNYEKDGQKHYRTRVIASRVTLLGSAPSREDSPSPRPDPSRRAPVTSQRREPPDLGDYDPHGDYGTRGAPALPKGPARDDDFPTPFDGDEDDIAF